MCLSIIGVRELRAFAPLKDLRKLLLRCERIDSGCIDVICENISRLEMLHLSGCKNLTDSDGGVYARFEPPESPVRLMYTAPPAVQVSAFLEALRGLRHRRNMVIPIALRPLLFVPVHSHAPLTMLEVDARARELREARLADVENKANEGRQPCALRKPRRTASCSPA